jgi:excisionase family DNA binding protein
MKELQSDWVTRDEAAQYLGVSIPTIKAWERKGMLDARRISYRVLRISAVSIEKMMERAKQPRQITVSTFTRTIAPKGR